VTNKNYAITIPLLPGGDKIQTLIIPIPKNDTNTPINCNPLILSPIITNPITKLNPYTTSNTTLATDNFPTNIGLPHPHNNPVTTAVNTVLHHGSNPSVTRCVIHAPPYPPPHDFPRFTTHNTTIKNPKIPIVTNQDPYATTITNHFITHNPPLIGNIKISIIPTFTTPSRAGGIPKLPPHNHHPSHQRTLSRKHNTLINKQHLQNSQKQKTIIPPNLDTSYTTPSISSTPHKHTHSIFFPSYQQSP
jgi:hypothetical protein